MNKVCVDMKEYIQGASSEWMVVQALHPKLLHIPGNCDMETGLVSVHHAITHILMIVSWSNIPCPLWSIRFLLCKISVYSHFVGFIFFGSFISMVQEPKQTLMWLHLVEHLVALKRTSLSKMTSSVWNWLFNALSQSGKVKRCVTLNYYSRALYRSSDK